MTLSEIKEWIKKAQYVDIAYDEYSNDNNYCTKVYEFDGRLYTIDFCNGHVDYYWDGGRHVKDFYKPIPVKRKVCFIKEYSYEQCSKPIIRLRGDD